MRRCVYVIDVLGMCSYLEIFKTGKIYGVMGDAVIFVLGITSLV